MTSAPDGFARRRVWTSVEVRESAEVTSIEMGLAGSVTLTRFAPCPALDRVTVYSPGGRSAWTDPLARDPVQFRGYGIERLLPGGRQ